MTLEFFEKDKYGSYKLNFVDNILRATVVGAIGESLSKKFTRDVQQICTQINLPCWGYYGDLSQCEGYTGQAARHLPEANRVAAEAGCKVDAYFMTSALAISQMSKMREQAGNESNFAERMFASEQQALEFIRQFLHSYQQRRSLQE